jgi:hypothetical protein
MVLLDKGKDELLKRKDVHQGKSALVVFQKFEITFEVFFLHMPLAARFVTI